MWRTIQGLGKCLRRTKKLLLPRTPLYPRDRNFIVSLSGEEASLYIPIPNRNNIRRVRKSPAMRKHDVVFLRRVDILRNSASCREVCVIKHDLYRKEGTSQNESMRKIKKFSCSAEIQKSSCHWICTQNFRSCSSWIVLPRESVYSK